MYSLQVLKKKSPTTQQICSARRGWMLAACASIRPRRGQAEKTAKAVTPREAIWDVGGISQENLKG